MESYSDDNMYSVSVSALTTNFAFPEVNYRKPNNKVQLATSSFRTPSHYFKSISLSAFLEILAPQFQREDEIWRIISVGDRRHLLLFSRFMLCNRRTNLLPGRECGHLITWKTFSALQRSDFQWM